MQSGVLRHCWHKTYIERKLTALQVDSWRIKQPSFYAIPLPPGPGCQQKAAREKQAQYHETHGHPSSPVTAKNSLNSMNFVTAAVVQNKSGLQMLDRLPVTFTATRTPCSPSGDNRCQPVTNQTKDSMRLCPLIQIPQPQYPQESIPSAAFDIANSTSQYTSSGPLLAMKYAQWQNTMFEVCLVCSASSYIIKQSCVLGDGTTGSKKRTSQLICKH